MNQKIINQSGGSNIEPEKLYTQSDVDGFYKDWDNNQTTPAEEVINETQTANKQKRLDDRVVSNLVKKSNRILVNITSHAFPFDFFPNIINVEEGRITIINRSYLFSEVHSVDIKDISNIFINISALSSELIIISKTFENNEVKIKNLRTSEAILVRRIIEGLRIFENKQINTTNYSAKDLVSILKRLSTTEITT